MARRNAGEAPPATTEADERDGRLSLEEANALVEEHRTWAEAIARSVARGWNLDWQMDGLDGAAMEALIFCARRFQPERGVPFRGYARKRIHEAATEAARKSRGWRKSSSASKNEVQARELSAELLQIYPELRSGEVPIDDDGGGDDGLRGAARQLLMSATLLSTRSDVVETDPEAQIDQKKMVQFMVSLEPVHQHLLFKVYWEGLSMRTVATEWDTDELNVIREHKILLGYLLKSFGRQKPPLKPKVRPGLKSVANRLKGEFAEGPFSRLLA